MAGSSLLCTIDNILRHVCSVGGVGGRAAVDLCASVCVCVCVWCVVCAHSARITLHRLSECRSAELSELRVVVGGEIIF